MKITLLTSRKSKVLLRRRCVIKWPEGANAVVHLDGYLKIS
jgi:hypothetical protein